MVNARLPTEKAHGLQVMRQCEAFLQSGVDVRLYHALRFQSPDLHAASRAAGGSGRRVSPFDYYQCPPFPARALPTADLQIPLEPFVGTELRRALFLLQSASFAGWASFHALGGGDRWIYTRDFYYAAALSAAGAGHRTIFEAHRHPDRHRAAHVACMRRLAGVVCITEGLRDILVEEGVPADSLCVAPDAVRLADFDALPDRDTARRRLGLDPGRPLAVYAGHLFAWKGVETLVTAARDLPGADVLLLGGAERDQQGLVRSLQPTPNVLLRSHVAPAEVPPVLAAADVLVLPSSGKTEMGRTYTSPMKLFEYMASGRPIVASDLPSLREVLEPGSTALMPPADDAPALAAAIRQLIGDPTLASRLATAARQRVTAHTWQARTERILAFLESR